MRDANDQALHATGCVRTKCVFNHPRPSSILLRLAVPDQRLETHGFQEPQTATPSLSRPQIATPRIDQLNAQNRPIRVASTNQTLWKSGFKETKISLSLSHRYTRKTQILEKKTVIALKSGHKNWENRNHLACKDIQEEYQFLEMAPTFFTLKSGHTKRKKESILALKTYTKKSNWWKAYPGEPDRSHTNSGNRICQTQKWIVSPSLSRNKKEKKKNSVETRAISGTEATRSRTTSRRSLCTNSKRRIGRTKSRVRGGRRLNTYWGR